MYPYFLLTVITDPAKLYLFNIATCIHYLFVFLFIAIIDPSIWRGTWLAKTTQVPPTSGRQNFYQPLKRYIQLIKGETYHPLFEREMSNENLELYGIYPLPLTVSYPRQEVKQCAYCDLWYNLHVSLSAMSKELIQLMDRT